MVIDFFIGYISVYLKYFLESILGYNIFINIYFYVRFFYLYNNFVICFIFYNLWLDVESRE